MVEFQSQTNFYGKFVYKNGRLVSTAKSNQFPELNFRLELVQSEQSFDNPKQLWRFVSDSAVSIRFWLFKVERFN